MLSPELSTWRFLTRTLLQCYSPLFVDEIEDQRSDVRTYIYKAQLKVGCDRSTAPEMGVSEVYFL